MPRLIRGSELNASQRSAVLARFIHRWTVENLQQSGKAPPRMETVTDEQWLADHAFWFVNDGSRLSDARAHRYAEDARFLPAQTTLDDHVSRSLQSLSYVDGKLTQMTPVPGFDPISKEDRPLLPYRAPWLNFEIETRGGRSVVFLHDLPLGHKLVASFYGPSAEENARQYVAWRKGGA